MSSIYRTLVCIGILTASSAWADDATKALGSDPAVCPPEARKAVTHVRAGHPGKLHRVVRSSKAYPRTCAREAAATAKRQVAQP